MKNKIVILLICLFALGPVASAQDIDFWLSSEGSGISISTGSHYYHRPPPPPRCDRHYHKKHKKHHKHHKHHKKDKKYYKHHRAVGPTLHRFNKHHKHYDHDDD